MLVRKSLQRSQGSLVTKLSGLTLLPTALRWRAARRRPGCGLASQPGAWFL